MLPKKSCGLALQPLPQRVVEVGEYALHGHDGVEVAQIEPLPREVLDERRGAFVGEHALHLSLEHLRVAQLTALRRAEQLVVGDAAP